MPILVSTWLVPSVIARRASGTSQMAAQVATVEKSEVKLGREVADGDVLAVLLRKKPIRPAAMMMRGKGTSKQ